jgi:hypothetical protein
MPAERKGLVALYVDRASRHWVVRDPDGNFWKLPPTATPWEERQPFTPADDTELESVPGHYRDMLGLPF